PSSERVCEPGVQLPRDTGGGSGRGAHQLESPVIQRLRRETDPRAQLELSYRRQGSRLAHHVAYGAQGVQCERHRAARTRCVAALAKGVADEESRARAGARVRRSLRAQALLQEVARLAVILADQRQKPASLQCIGLATGIIGTPKQQLCLL